MKDVRTDLESITKEGGQAKDDFSLQDCVPIGSFAGSQDLILRIRNGKPIVANTGDQGGGQN